MMENDKRFERVEYTALGDVRYLKNTENDKRLLVEGNIAFGWVITQIIECAGGGANQQFW